jgi:uncharacterized protein YndB with AHSA1/START domain
MRERVAGIPQAERSLARADARVWAALTDSERGLILTDRLMRRWFGPRCLIQSSLRWDVYC